MSIASRWTGQVLNFFSKKHNPAFPAGCFADAPLLAWLADPSIGHYIMEDFNNIDAATLAGYTVTQASTGTFALDTIAGGVALADCNSGTQHQGVNIQKLGPCITPAADKDIWFEAIFKVVDSAITVQMFAGLAEVDTTLMPNGVMDSTNADYIGIGVPTTLAGVSQLYGCKATAEDTIAGIKTLVEDTYVKVGFKVTGIEKVEYWIDDVKGATTILTANIPIIPLTPSFVCQTDSTTDPILHLDMYRCFQIR